MKHSWLLALAFLAGGCAPALRTPPPVARLAPDIVAPGVAPAIDVDAVLAQAETRFARRPRIDEARAAQKLFLEAARGDESRVEGLLGLARSTSWLIEHESDPEERRALAAVGVQAAQLCAERAPSLASCDYALAIALGQQARERPATGRDAVGKMVAALERAIAQDPLLDGAGPHRVLALVYLRAPGWPAGPGDALVALRQAQLAVALVPEHPPNQLALAEALRRNERREEARSTYLRALELARARLAVGDPDASQWMSEATKALGPA